MPAHILPSDPERASVAALSVIGHCGRGAHVHHVAISRVAGDACHGQIVAVAHMRPPLADQERIAAHLVGWLDLDEPERIVIDVWLRAALTRTNTEYCIVPAVDDVVDRTTGRLIRRRFSCTGFVHACYEESIDVVLVDQDALPEVDLATLMQVWDERVIRLGRARGYLQGQGPWRAMLPAHLFHALAQPNPRAAPYQPTTSNWTFP
jgi:hypothetical protein